VSEVRHWPNGVEWTPKYLLGQSVVSMRVAEQLTPHLCPHCNGEGAINYVTMAGKPRRSICGDCDSGIQHGPERRLVAKFRNLTIGQVDVKHRRVGDADHGWRLEREVRYMADETGVGSGTVYEERNLYPSEQAAQAAAEASGATWRAKAQ